MATQVAEGRWAGQSAGAFCGHGHAPVTDELDFLHQQKAAEPKRTSARVLVPGHASRKRLVCFCEDVTDNDIETAMAEGYNSLELLPSRHRPWLLSKRYVSGLFPSDRHRTHGNGWLGLGVEKTRCWCRMR